MSDAWIMLPFMAFFAWQIYKYRKAILHNMKLYGDYFAILMQQKVDEKQKEYETKTKNERR